MPELTSPLLELPQHPVMERDSPKAVPPRASMLTPCWQTPPHFPRVCESLEQSRECPLKLLEQLQLHLQCLQPRLL